MRRAGLARISQFVYPLQVRRGGTLSSSLSARLLQAFLVPSRRSLARKREKRARAARQIKDTRYSLALLGTFPPAPEITRPENLFRIRYNPWRNIDWSPFHYAFRTISSIAPWLMASRETHPSLFSFQAGEKPREKGGIHTGASIKVSKFLETRGEDGRFSRRSHEDDRSSESCAEHPSASLGLRSIEPRGVATSKEGLLLSSVSRATPCGVHGRDNELVTKV